MCLTFAINILVAMGTVTRRIPQLQYCRIVLIHTRDCVSDDTISDLIDQYSMCDIIERILLYLEKPGCTVHALKIPEIMCSSCIGVTITSVQLRLHLL